MLRKLLKYEFRSIGRLLLFIYAAVIVVALILGGAFRKVSYDPGHYPDLLTYSGNSASDIFSIIYMILLMAMVIITLVMIILRFYKNLLGQEGYLMHTLPVPKWMLVASKTITSLIWVLIGIAVSALSLVIILHVSGVTGLWAGLLNTTVIDFAPGQIVFAICWMLVSIVAVILRFYFSMAVGNLANRHKFVFAVVVFIAVTIVIAILQNTVISFSVIHMALTKGPNGETFVGAMEIRELIFQIILAAAFFAGTTWILQKRLNLE